MEAHGHPTFSREFVFSLQNIYPKPKNWSVAPHFQRQCAACRTTVFDSSAIIHLACCCCSIIMNTGWLLLSVSPQTRLSTCSFVRHFQRQCFANRKCLLVQRSTSRSFSPHQGVFVERETDSLHFLVDEAPLILAHNALGRTTKGFQRP